MASTSPKAAGNILSPCSVLPWRWRLLDRAGIRSSGRTQGRSGGGVEGARKERKRRKGRKWYKRSHRERPEAAWRSSRLTAGLDFGPFRLFRLFRPFRLVIFPIHSSWSLL